MMLSYGTLGSHLVQGTTHLQEVTQAFRMSSASYAYLFHDTIIIHNDLTQNIS